MRGSRQQHSVGRGPRPVCPVDCRCSSCTYVASFLCPILSAICMLWEGENYSSVPSPSLVDLGLVDRLDTLVQVCRVAQVPYLAQGCCHHSWAGSGRGGSAITIPLCHILLEKPRPGKDTSLQSHTTIHQRGQDTAGRVCFPSPPAISCPT